MTTENTTTTVEIRANDLWPDEANLAAFAAEDDRLEHAEQPAENDFEYAALYFVS